MCDTVPSLGLMGWHEPGPCLSESSFSHSVEGRVCMSCAEDSETSVSDLGHLILLGTESEAMVSPGNLVHRGSDMDKSSVVTL